MTISPVTPAHRDDFAVVPVVEYEPPPREVSRNPTPCRQPTVAHRTGGGPRRPYRGRAVRRPEPTAAAWSASMHQAAAFADAALRRVLEVIDHRRPVTQLRPLLVPGLVDSVLSVGQSRAGRQGAAVLRRMRLQPAGHRAAETAAEVFGSYSRGDRIHAIAARVEKLPTSSGVRWQVVALHIG
ncbi:Rv3235 family protein [Mycobacterium sp. Aquia_213]|uniref:Rv3235 family protein n=1 Tax=Mycobacterium sp. Aquia_213 TaxID=2991728 RepID=UPI002271D8C5|nr:Rv3235 family protein [Mycobacterium sp. Aquia_213]WAC90488.1 Rv3235 family protein [Mycobacterium sp. Aquia_213]